MVNLDSNSGTSLLWMPTVEDALAKAVGFGA